MFERFKGFLQSNSAVEAKKEDELTDEEKNAINNALSELEPMVDRFDLSEIEKHRKIENEKRILRIGRKSLPLIKDRFLNRNDESYYFSVFADTLSDGNDASLLLEAITDPKIIDINDRSSLSRITNALNRAVYLIRRGNPNDSRLKEIAEKLIPVAEKFDNDKQDYLNQIISLTGTEEARVYVSKCKDKHENEQREFLDSITNYPDYRLTRPTRLGGQDDQVHFEEGLIKDEFNNNKPINYLKSEDLYSDPYDDPFFDPYDDPFEYPNDDIELKNISEDEIRSRLSELDKLLKLLGEPHQGSEIFDNNEKEKEKEYEFFEDPKEREELYGYTKRIVKYLSDEKVEDLVIVDRSSRPLYIAVREYWKKRGVKGEMPNIYFINPLGFKAKEDLTKFEIEELKLKCMYNDDGFVSSDKIKKKEEIIKEFHKEYKELISDKDKPVVIFDTCIHSGDSLYPVKKIFEESGFSDLRIGSVHPADSSSKVKEDFFLTSLRPEKGCYPFDRDRMIEKTFSSTSSMSNADRNKRIKSSRLRREIQRIIDECIEDESNKIEIKNINEDHNESENEEVYEGLQKKIMKILDEYPDVPSDLKSAIEKWSENIFDLAYIKKVGYEEYVSNKDPLWQIWGTSAMLEEKVENSVKNDKEITQEEIMEIKNLYLKAAKLYKMCMHAKTESSAEIECLANGIDTIVEIMKKLEIGKRK